VILITEKFLHFLHCFNITLSRKHGMPIKSTKRHPEMKTPDNQRLFTNKSLPKLVSVQKFRQGDFLENQAAEPKSNRPL
jgi:hypothetical protein